METAVYKFTLSSKKEIFLREPKMSDSEGAIKVAGLKAGEKNVALLGLLTQKEMFKKMLVQVDDRKLGMTEKENINALFTFKEWSQCMQALSQLTGHDEEEGKLEAPEIMTTGDKSLGAKDTQA